MSYFEGIYSAFLGNLGEHWILLIHLVIDCLAYQQLTIYTKLQVIWTRTVTYKIFFKFRFLVSPGSIFGSYMRDGQQVSKFRFSPTQKMKRYSTAFYL